MKEKGPLGGTIALAVLLLLPVLYVGSYYVLVKAEFTELREEEGVISRIEGYRTSWSWAKDFYYPMNRIDRGIRRSYWYYDLDSRLPPQW